MSSLKNALSIAKKLNNLNLIGQAKINYGEVYFNLGELGKAYNSFQEALEIMLSIGDFYQVNICANSLAILSNQLGLYEQSISYSNYVLKMAKANGNSNSEACVLTIIASNNWKLGKNNEAIEYINQSIELDLRENRITQAAVSINQLVYYYIDTNQIKEALQIAKESYRIAKENSNEYLEVHSLQSIGNCYYKNGDFENALVYLKKALDINSKYNSPSTKSSILYSIGITYQETGKIIEAIDSFRASIALNENMRNNIKNEDFRVSYADTFENYNVYYVLSSLLVKESIKNPTNSFKYIDEAFIVCENRRSKLVQDYFTLSYDSIESEINIKKIQKDLLDTDTALLEYSIHNNYCLLWVITDDNCKVLFIETNELYNKVESIRQTLQNRKVIENNYKSYLEDASFLYQLLIQPAETDINGRQNLIIVPDSYLHLIPFQALLSETTEYLFSLTKENSFFNFNHNFSKLPYLIKKYNITYAPSSSILMSLITRNLKNVLDNFIAFAPIAFNQFGTNVIEDYLPGTKEEVLKISKLFDKSKISLKLEKEAKKEYLLNNNHFRFIHIASHSIFSDIENSTMILLHGDVKEEALVSHKEIAQSNLSTDVVTLSACKTALGKLSPSEGVIGLIRAFFIAGAKSVCASLWNVDDKSTAELMYKFYKNMLILL